ncbi:SDR family NAD(P)-dependent oxidoreductase [Candidatus Sumerlaeota bacterium]|nr:SDR family NAD(P)-dependent oxidoreductase [Candidatus Sumerlaeota bacterium]
MKILITGGAGFIGSNLTDYYLRQGAEVVVFDNLSRPGTEKNLDWLQRNHRGSRRFTFIKGDVRRMEELHPVVRDAEVVIHLAGQVAVTNSIADPRTDFEVNALGTFNVLEAVRLYGNNPIFIFVSTNKVYGKMEDIAVVEHNKRYIMPDYPEGIPEERCLDFHSPYGCSKGTAEQYVRDYARIYDIPSVVFRMSCQYGIRQFGNEDQGWVAHFVISAILGKSITIYGNGKQVRDVLYIDDLIRAFEMAIASIDKTKGNIYNIGGGPGFTLSLLELVELLEGRLGCTIPLEFGEWHAGDQPVYISNIRKAYRDFGWSPQIKPADGIDKLITWVKENKELFE